MRRRPGQRRRGVAAPQAMGMALVAGLLGFAPATRPVRDVPAAPVGMPSTIPDESPVADAAMRGDTVLVRTLLRAGADVNAAQGDGMTALHWSALRGNAAQAQMLIVAGARLDATTRNGHYTPLHLASREGKAATAAVLLDAGADVNAPTASGGATPLHMAAGNGDTAIVRVLLAHRAAVDSAESAFGQTPLMWAAAKDRVGAVRLLLAEGADVARTSRVADVSAEEKAARAALTIRTKKMAALRAAEQATAVASTGAAAKAGPDSAAARTTTTMDSSHVVAPEPTDAAPAKGEKAIAAAKKIARPTDARDARNATARGDSAALTSGKSAPTSAADSARAAADRRSLSYGDLVGKSGGLTPLLFAVREGNAATIDVLLAAGADVNQVSAGDHTSPLLMATINGQFDVAMLLLERGAKPTLASDAGATPLYATINVQWAAKSLYPQPTAQLQQQTTHLQLMEALLTAGAAVNARLNKHLWFMSYNFDLLGVNTEGATPFWRATYGLDLPAMKLLLAHGADPSVGTKKPAGRLRGDDAPAPGEGGPPKDQSGLEPIPVGGPGVFPIHAASGVGYGEGYAANSHRHAPDAWLPTVRFLLEELHVDVNARDHNGYTPLHHAAARGDNALIEYLMSKGADITAVSRKGQTVADMANGPVQRIPPFVDTVALLERLGSKNSHKCKSC